MKVTKINTDETLRELICHGTPGFQFEYYIDDVHAFDKGYVDWHWHDEFEWMYLKEGEARVCIGGEEILLFLGDSLFINSRALHEIRSKNGATLPNILFSGSFISEEFSDIYEEYVLPVISSEKEYLVFRGDDDKNEDILTQLKKTLLLCENKEDNKLEIHAQLCLLWAELKEKYADVFLRKKSRADMIKRARMQKMLTFIYENHAREISLNDIAGAAKISKTEAIRCFTGALGMPPVEFLIDYRLTRARALILSGGAGVLQAALLCGFNNVSYFIRAFKKKYSVTPGKLKPVKN